MAKLPDPTLREVKFVHVEDWEQRQQDFLDIIAKSIKRTLQK